MRQDIASASEVHALRPVEVVLIRGDWHVIGFLFLEGKSVLVLANNMVAGSDLGPIQPTKIRRIANEADFTIIPRNLVESLRVLSP